MLDVIIIGAGGHAAEIVEYINCSYDTAVDESLRILGLIDDNPDSYERYHFSAPYLGTIKGHEVKGDVNYIIGIANLTYRKTIVERFLQSGAEFVTIVHKNAYLSPSSFIGNGVVIGPYVNIGPNVRVGNFNLLNSRCSLGHDTLIGDYNFISPNVSFSGGTVIGDNNLFGINAATIPNIVVGNNNKIAAGMVLNKSIGNNEVVFFRYKEKVIAIPK
mgnify:CR=1 FL=1